MPPFLLLFVLFFHFEIVERIEKEGGDLGNCIIKLQGAWMFKMRKILTWFGVGEVYSTTSPEEEGAISGRVMQERVRRGEGYYLRWGFLQDNPTVELGDSAFLEAWFPAYFQVGAWMSRRRKVGPP